jgi:hypothetical protein
MVSLQPKTKMWNPLLVPLFLFTLLKQKGEFCEEENNAKTTRRNTKRKKYIIEPKKKKEKRKVHHFFTALDRKTEKQKSRMNCF